MEKAQIELYSLNLSTQNSEVPEIFNESAIFQIYRKKINVYQKGYWKPSGK